MSRCLTTAVSLSQSSSERNRPMTKSLEEDIRAVLAGMDEKEKQDNTQPTQEEIQDVYVLIVREQNEADDQVHVVDSTPTVPTQPAPVTAAQDSFLSAYIFVCVSLLLIASVLAFQLYCIYNPPIATVTILPKSQQVSLSGTVQLGRVVNPITLSQSQTTKTTGIGHQSAAQARGYITFYNGQFESVTIAAGTILTGASGIEVVTDFDATIPAGNPPSYGQITIAAHAVSVGTGGNIPSFAINQVCCTQSVLAKNTTAFSGGQDERDYTAVSKSDISGAATPLKVTVAQSINAALTGQLKAHEVMVTPSCTTTINSNHQPGDEATQVKVTVSETCKAVAYNAPQLENSVTKLLTAQATKKLGNGYSLLGNPAIHVTRAIASKPILLAFTSASTWIYAFSNAEQQHIKNIIAGKTKERAIELLSSLPGIQIVSLHVSGFGDDTRIPKNLHYIHLSIFYGV